LLRLVAIASWIDEEELTMKRTRLEKIRKPANATNPLTADSENRLVK